MKLFLRILCGLVLLLAGAALLVVIGKGSGLELVPNEQISRADYLSIILTSLAVMLTTLTIFLGVLAIFGWATFETRVKQSSESFLDKRFSENDPRYLKLVNELKKDVRSRIKLDAESPSTLENESNADEDVD